MHPEVARPTASIQPTCRLQQLMCSHDPLDRFAVHRFTQLSAGQRGDHAGAVGRVRPSDLHDRCVAITRHW